MSRLEQEIRHAIAALERGSLSDVRRHLEAALRDEDVTGWQFQYSDGTYFCKRGETKSYSTFSRIGDLKNSIGWSDYYKMQEIVDGYVITIDNETIPFRQFCEENQWVPSWRNRNWSIARVFKPEWFSEIESKKK